MASIASSAPDQRHIQLVAAATKADEPLVRSVLAEQPSWNTSHDRDALRLALQRVAARGKLSLVQLLLEYGAEVNSLRETEIPPLVKAAEGGHTAVVTELLAHKADPNFRKPNGQIALHTASLKGYNKIVKILLDAGAATDAREKEDRTPLLYIASEKSGRWSMETVKMLLDYGSDIDVRDISGRTPLLWAATNGNVALVSALLSGELGKTADISVVNYRGRTALQLAAETNHEDMVKLLLERGVDVCAVSDGGWTALHNAAQTGYTGVVRLLLEAGADINAELSNGMTPIHWAASNGHEEVVKLLLERPNVNLAVKDGFGRTPMLCAAEKDRTGVIELLSPDQLANRLTPTAQRACREFEATVVLFQRSGKKQIVNKHSIHDLLYGWEWDATRTVKKPKVNILKKNIKDDPGFRWIHLPANNIAWVETLLERYFVEGEYRDIEAFKALEKCFDQEHRGPLAHAHFMRTFCHRISPPQPHVPPKEPKETKPLIPLIEEPSEVMTKSGQLAGPATPQQPVLDQGETSTPKSDSKKKSKADQIAERHPKRGKRASGHPGNPPGTKAAKAAARQPAQLAWDASDLSTSSISGPTGTLVLFMPFLHYETDQRRREMSHAISCVRNGRPLMEEPSPDDLLVSAYLKHAPPLHPRRTLDQFFYHGIDTSKRDTDQVVYRYCQRHRVEKKVFMVDQLWIWVLGKDLVITCFPQRWKQPRRDPLNVLEGIIEETNAKTRPPIQSVYDLAMLITSRCSGMFDRHRLDVQDYQFLDMFESSIGLVTNEESQLFERFNEASKKSAEWLHENQRDPRRHPTSPSPDEDGDGVAKGSVFPDALLDIGTETRLLAEIKDIRDELSIIAAILNNQMVILEQFESHIVDELNPEGSRRAEATIVREIQKRSRDQKRLFETHRKDIERMDKQGEIIYNSLRDLLDLKQKHSNALEARFARDHAAIAARQGQTIMMFTIVTIIFLPMSFIAAFLAINIDDFSGGLPLANVSKYTFGIGLGISIPLIAMALAAPDILSIKYHLLGGGRRRNQEETPESEPDNPRPTTSRPSVADEKKKWGSYEGTTSPRLRPVSYDQNRDRGYAGLTPVSRGGSATRKISVGSAWGRPSHERSRGLMGEDLEKGVAGPSRLV